VSQDLQDHKDFFEENFKALLIQGLLLRVHVFFSKKLFMLFCINSLISFPQL